MQSVNGERCDGDAYTVRLSPNFLAEATPLADDAYAGDRCVIAPALELLDRSRSSDAAKPSDEQCAAERGRPADALGDTGDVLVVAPAAKRDNANRVRHVQRALRDLVAADGHGTAGAGTDSLTGLVTHSFLKELIVHETRAARRYNKPVSLVFADIDHFDRINERFGPVAGDQIIRDMARTIRDATRNGDTVSRFGGEEFAILLPNSPCGDAQRLAERVRMAVESRPFTLRHGNELETLRLTVSLGVSAFPDDATDAASLIQHAEEALFAAKQAGRNSIVTFGETGDTQSQQRVLIVDDEERNLRLLEAYLEPEGLQILRAHDGEEALDVARQLRPDLILMDGIMPRMHGFDVCRRLKRESATSLVPVVIVTSLAGREDRIRGIESGADDFLNKPVDRAELVARVRSLLKSKRSTDLLEDAEAVIFTLARAVESRDPSTGGHVERVSHYAHELGKALDLPETKLEGLRRAGVVHDIGKIVVPDNVLLKPGQLTPEERKIMERHVEVGYELLKPLRTFAESLPAVRFHHERLDGSGYPLGLRGDQVPVVAQIMAIVDVYDALTTDRVYRAAMTKQEAFRILRDEAARGLHDASLVETFIGLVSERA
jgi:putative two-component system response regulator